MVVLLPVFVSQKLTPVYPLKRFHWLSIAGFLFGFVWETVADVQKYVFKSDPSNRGKWIQDGQYDPCSMDITQRFCPGLFHYSRYPNYFGEMVVWASMCVLASNKTVMRKAPWVVISPIFVYLLLRYVSGVSILEAAHDEKYSGDLFYLQYKERTNLLFPWYPKKIKL